MAARKTFDSFQAKEHLPEKVRARVKKLRERNPAAVLLGTYGAKKRYAKAVGNQIPEGNKNKGGATKGRRKASKPKTGEG